jgi:hypothetical protein
MSVFAEVQGVTVGSSLVVAGLSKLTTASDGTQTVLHRLWNEVRRAPRLRGLSGQFAAVWRTVAAFEVALGLSTFLPQTHQAAEAAAALMLGFALAVLLWGLRYAPDSSCGCFGASGSLSLWVLGRTLWLLGAAVVATAAGGSGVPSLTSPDRYVGWALLNLVILAAGSSAVRAFVRRQAAAAYASAVVPVGPRARVVALAQLQSTPYWSGLREDGIARAEHPTRVWRQRGWVMMDFPGQLDGGEIQIVGGVCPGYTPPWVRFAFVSSSPAAEHVLDATWDSLRLQPVDPLSLPAKHADGSTASRGGDPRGVAPFESYEVRH